MACTMTLPHQLQIIKAGLESEESWIIHASAGISVKLVNAYQSEHNITIVQFQY